MTSTIDINYAESDAERTINTTWYALSRRLITEIVELFTKYSSTDQNIADSDLAKLLTSADRLEQLCDQEIDSSGVGNQKMWHDLRNILGAIIGYTELIIEDSMPPAPMTNALLSVQNAAKKILHDGQISSKNNVTGQVQLPIVTETGVILVVDDQAESRDLLNRQLKRDGHTVIEAASGNEMLQILEEETVDLILLDLILQEMDGQDLLVRIKQEPKWRAIPVIVVSGMQDTQRVIGCIEAGAEDYLFKPFNPILLQARISAGVERKRWHDKEKQYREELEKNQRFIRNIFGRYLSNEIVDTLLENPDGLNLGGMQCKVTVLMADIRGFTSIAEQLPPQRVVRLLNHYLGSMAEIIMQYNGTVDEFIGDAILAIFGAPISRENDTDSALACALAMQDAMEEINKVNRQELLPEINIGISLNTGLVVAGNIGSEKRAKYGVVGHPVNQTARIEEHCAAGKIMISESTLRDSQQLLCISKTQTIKAKGIKRAFNIYEVDCIKAKI